MLDDLIFEIIVQLSPLQVKEVYLRIRVEFQPGSTFVYAFHLIVEGTRPFIGVVWKHNVHEKSRLNSMELMEVLLTGPLSFNETVLSRINYCACLTVYVAMLMRKEGGLHFSLDQVADNFHFGVVMQFHSEPLGKIVQADS